jgi:uncharacterized membrane protein
MEERNDCLFVDESFSHPLILNFVEILFRYHVVFNMAENELELGQVDRNGTVWQARHNNAPKTVFIIIIIIYYTIDKYDLAVVHPKVIYFA